MRLSIPKDPYWIDLSGLSIRLHVRPLTQAVVDVANAKAARSVRELVDHQAAITDAGGAVEGLPDLTDEDVRRGLAEAEFTKALGRAAIIGWENVFGDGDEPAPVTHETVGDLLSVWPVGERFRIAYLAPLEALAAEKNGSGPAPHGTSAAGRDTAGSATTTEVPAPAEAEA